MAYIYYGQKWADFGAKRVQLQKPAIHIKQLPKSAKITLVIGDLQ